MMNLKVSKVLALIMLCAATTLCACGNDPGAGTTEAPVELSKEANYKVTVTDMQGKPFSSGVIVRFLKDGQQVSMQVADENGTVEKVMERGDYTVELKFTDSKVEYAYDESKMTLSAEKTELTVQMADTVTGEGVDLFVGEGALKAYSVGVTSTQVPLKAGARSYFLFAPKMSGTYEISMLDEGTSIGCYGTVFYVQEFSIVEVIDNKMIMSITPDMVGSGDGGANVMVIGVDSESAESAILTIERVGEHQWTIEDEPWTVYEKTVELEKYQMPEGMHAVPFNLTAKTEDCKLVFNEEDGFYHKDTADGPLVVMFLGKDSQYIMSYKEITSKTSVVKYFFDENGKFQKKERYNPCLREYIEYIDEAAGVYPLTEDLKYIVQQHGDHAGWWDLDSNTSVFYDSKGNKVGGINEEIAWLLMCGYLEEVTEEDVTKEAETEAGKTK